MYARSGTEKRNETTRLISKKLIVGSIKWSAVAFVIANPLKIRVASVFDSSRFDSESTIGTSYLILTRNTVHADRISRSTRDCTALAIVKFGSDLVNSKLSMFTRKFAD